MPKLFRFYSAFVAVMLFGAGCTSENAVSFPVTAKPLNAYKPAAPTPSQQPQPLLNQNKPSTAETPEDGKKSGTVTPTNDKETTGIVACTGFEFSRWSQCAADGTQNRVITKTLPSDNCYGGDPIQERKCTYVLQDFGTGADILRKIRTQIKLSPNQMVDMEYRSGDGGGLITKTQWSIDDQNRYRIHTSTRNADTQEVTSVLDLIDVNQDGQPDYFIANNGQVQKLDLMQPGHKEVLVTWVVMNTFFGSYILN